MNILHIDTSILGDHSVSRQLTAATVARLKDDHADAVITHYDLAASPIAHLNGPIFMGLGKTGTDRVADFAVEHGLSDKVMSDFLAADVIVIGAPMYNFSVSSQLKSWIDRIMVAGKTFRYTAHGSEGLVGSKRVIIISSRGGIFSPGTVRADMDHQESYLRTVFGVMGIANIDVVRAEGLAMGPESAANGMAEADRHLLALA